MTAADEAIPLWLIPRLVIGVRLSPRYTFNWTDRAAAPPVLSTSISNRYQVAAARTPTLLETITTPALLIIKRAPLGRTAKIATLDVPALLHIDKILVSPLAAKESW